MGEKTGLFAGLTTILSDTLMEVAGHLMVRAYLDQAAGTTDLRVDGLHRWATAGRVIIDRESYKYTSITRTVTANVLHGLSHSSGTAGLRYAVDKGTPITYFSEDYSDVDKMALSFFVEFAEGTDLDLYARNFGLYRPRGMTDDTFRALLKVMVYLDATTIGAVEKVLTALGFGGNYEVWDTPLDPVDHHKVFIRLAPSPSNVFRGKTFMCGGEAKTRTTTTKVTTTYNPTVVYGVYARTSVDAATDRQTNPNLLNRPFGGITTPANPTYLRTLVDVFVASDVGRVIALDSVQVWEILSFLNPRTVVLGRPGLTGTASMGSPQQLSGDGYRFRSWMVGHKIQVTSASNPGNIQTATIDSFINTSTVGLSSMSGGGWAASDTALVFTLVPNFGTTFPAFVLPRYALAGNVITTVNTLPAALWVDYATVPSAQLCTDHTQNGDDQYPFFLYDDTWYVESVVDLILAAGCHPVVERT